MSALDELFHHNFVGPDGTSYDYFELGPLDDDDLDDDADDESLKYERSTFDKLHEEVDGNPTEDQKKAGNYRKAHVSWKGLPLTIETAKGQVRRGKSKGGKEWSQTMKDHYGYIKRTESEADGDHIDVFVNGDSDDPKSETVWVVNQNKPDGTFDEHKCMLGFDDGIDADEGYHRNYEKGWKGCGSIVEMTLDQFKEWIETGDSSKPVPSNLHDADDKAKKYKMQSGPMNFDGSPFQPEMVKPKLKYERAFNESKIHRGDSENKGHFASKGGGGTSIAGGGNVAKRVSEADFPEHPVNTKRGPQSEVEPDYQEFAQETTAFDPVAVGMFDNLKKIAAPDKLFRQFRHDIVHWMQHTVNEIGSVMIGPSDKEYFEGLSKGQKEFHQTLEEVRSLFAETQRRAENILDMGAKKYGRNDHRTVALLIPTLERLLGQLNALTERIPKEFRGRFKYASELESAIKYARGFDESKVKRDEAGKFAEHPGARQRKTEDGKDWGGESNDEVKSYAKSFGVKGSGTKENPFRCKGDIEMAAILLSHDFHVRLEQPDQVATLVDKLYDQFQEILSSGETPPSINLCKVTVPGTNLFCQKTKGIPRIKMPQLSGVPVPGSYAATKTLSEKGKVDVSDEFIKELRGSGIGVKDTHIHASHLRATQSELNGNKVVGMIHAAELGTFNPQHGEIFVTRDHYILDGHHRWAAAIGFGTIENKDLKMHVQKIDMDIGEAVDFANDFAKRIGMQPNAMASSDPRRYQR